MARKKKPPPAGDDRAFLNAFMLGHAVGYAEASQERIEKYEKFADDLLRRADAAINAARRELGLPALLSPIGRANLTLQ